MKKKSLKYIYNGIYNSYRSCIKKKNYSFYLDKFYENRQKQIIKEILKSIASKKPILSFHKQHTQYLINMISIIKKEKINILDIGGGWGVGYANCLEAFNKKKISNLNYHIFDLKNVCALGEKHFKKKLRFRAKLKYIDNLNKISSVKYDIIFFGSSLQYFSNPFVELKKILKINSSLLLFVDTYLTSTETFFTFQKYYKSGVPHSFLNKKKFLSILQKSYTLISSSYSHTTRLGKVAKINMNNFPKKYRVYNSFNLILSKKNEK